MSARLTVVFDEPELYRRLKVQAAQEGIPMKSIIQAAVAEYLERAGAGDAAPAEARPLDWERWDQFQAELDAIADEPGSEDASDIKHQLYGQPRRELSPQGWRYVAEEEAEYDAR
jgi:hypothetical protein